MERSIKNRAVEVINDENETPFVDRDTPWSELVHRLVRIITESRREK